METHTARSMLVGTLRGATSIPRTVAAAGVLLLSLLIAAFTPLPAQASGDAGSLSGTCAADEFRVSTNGHVYDSDRDPLRDPYPVGNARVYTWFYERDARTGELSRSRSEQRSEENGYFTQKYHCAKKGNIAYIAMRAYWRNPRTGSSAASDYWYGRGYFEGTGITSDWGSHVDFELATDTLRPA